MAIFRTAIFPTAIFQMAIFSTAVSFISIYTGSFTSFCNEPFTSLLLLHLKMSRLSRLDSSSSSDDDDEPELILGALHQAHTRYLAMHSPQWGALYLAVNIFIAIEKLDIGGCTKTIFQKLQHMTLLYFGAGV
jgi:hypothetical protein